MDNWSKISFIGLWIGFGLFGSAACNDALPLCAEVGPCAGALLGHGALFFFRRECARQMSAKLSFSFFVRLPSVSLYVSGVREVQSSAFRVFSGMEDFS